MKIDAKQEELLNALREFVNPWRKITIGVDGITGSGKSTLSRYLSWKLGMPLIETDMLRIMEEDPPAYRDKEILNLLNSRHKLNRPVIIEGVFTLDILSKINVTCDYLVYVENSEANGGVRYAQPLQEYDAKFKPKENSQFVLCTDFINSM